VTRNRINSSLWFGIAIPEDICEKSPEVKSYGIFRKLNDGNFEFVSICSDEYQDYFSIHKDDLERLLNEAGVKGYKVPFKKRTDRALDSTIPPIESKW